MEQPKKDDALKAGEQAESQEQSEQPKKKAKFTGWQYKESTYDTVLMWTAETLVEYKPNAKKLTTKSGVRYEKYSKAKTVAEALELGSIKEDLLHDYEAGILKVIGGPMREKILDPDSYRALYESGQITDVDTCLRSFISKGGRCPGIKEKFMTKASAEKIAGMRKLPGTQLGRLVKKKPDAEGAADKQAKDLDTKLVQAATAKPDKDAKDAKDADDHGSDSGKDAEDAKGVEDQGKKTLDEQILEAVRKLGYYPKCFAGGSGRAEMDSAQKMENNVARRIRKHWSVLLDATKAELEQLKAIARPPDLRRRESVQDGKGALGRPRVRAASAKAKQTQVATEAVAKDKVDASTAKKDDCAEAEALQKKTPEVDAAALRAELEVMSKSELRKRAAGLGVSEAALLEAIDAEDTKAALVELILAVEAPAALVAPESHEATTATVGAETSPSPKAGVGNLLRMFSSDSHRSTPEKEAVPTKKSRRTEGAGKKREKTLEEERQKATASAKRLLADDATKSMSKKPRAEDAEEADEQKDAEEDAEDVELDLPSRAERLEFARSQCSETKETASGSGGAQVGRATFMQIIKALQNVDEGPERSISAVEGLLRQVPRDSKHWENDLDALLTLLLPRKHYISQEILHKVVQLAFGLKKEELDADVADVALRARARQPVLFQPKRISVAEIADHLRELEGFEKSTNKGHWLTVAGREQFQQSGIKERLAKLFGGTGSDCNETWHLARALCDRSKLERTAVLRAFARLFPAPAFSDDVERHAACVADMEEAVVRGYALRGGEHRELVEMLVKGTNPTELKPSPGAHILPMRPEVSKDMGSALERLGEGPVFAEWLHSGEPAQVQMRPDGSVRVFVAQAGGMPPERLGEVTAAFKERAQGIRDAIFDVILVRPLKKVVAAATAEEGAPDTAAESPKSREAPDDKALFIFLSDVLWLDGTPYLDVPLRERRAKLLQIVQEHPRLRLTRGQELLACPTAEEKIRCELNAALSAGFLESREDRDANRVNGIVLKRLDGDAARYMPGLRAPAWQSIQKPPRRGAEAEEMLFAVLNEAERAALPEVAEFHFCVISGMRTKTAEGRQDILKTEAMFNAAGVKPKWYVDGKPGSVEEYCALGLDAIVGGKLIPARNLALEDSEKMGKLCVQISDDISKWEYYQGEEMAHKGDEEANAAWRRTEVLHVSPVAAARFLLARMRGSERKPQLGGVYPLGNAARACRSPGVTYHNFILGDFFVTEPGPIRFDTRLTLKEDYDFTCSHLAAHGAVLRSNRLIIHAKHETNDGGACAIRDPEGKEERKNIDILKEKWPGAIRNHTRRANQVMLTWLTHKPRAAVSEA